MRIQQVLTSAARASYTMAREYMPQIQPLAARPGPHAESVPARSWDHADDLTENFDDKLAEFMSFEDASASRRWLLDE